MKIFHKSIKLSGLRYLYLLVIPIFIVQVSPEAFGLTTVQKNLFNSGVYYFDASTSCSTSLTGADNREKAFNYFIAKGLNSEQSAAIIGNLKQESGINPTSKQSPGEGRGIAQWNQPADQPEGTGGRWGNLNKFAKGLSLDPLELSTQLDFVMYELTGHYQPAYTKFLSVDSAYSGSPAYAGDVASAINAEKAAGTLSPSNTLTEDQLLSTAWATVVFEEEYERAGKPNMSNRISYAIATLKEFGGSSSTQQTSSSNGCSNNCDLGANTDLANLSLIRQKVVCIAQQERDAWLPPKEALTNKRFLTYTGNISDQWCAYFLSWVYNQAGKPLQEENESRVAAVLQVEAIGKDGSSGFYYYPADSYTPRPGDLAIQRNSAKSISHLFMVTGVTSAKITVISGNNGEGKVFETTVSEYTLTLDKPGVYNPNYIVGYVSPDAK